MFFFDFVTTFAAPWQFVVLIFLLEYPLSPLQQLLLFQYSLDPCTFFQSCLLFLPPCYFCCYLPFYFPRISYLVRLRLDLLTFPLLHSTLCLCYHCNDMHYQGLSRFGDILYHFSLYYMLYVRGRSDQYLAYKRKTKILGKWRFISQHSLLLAQYTVAGGSFEVTLRNSTKQQLPGNNENK